MARIQTTHVGSLPRPDDLVALNAQAVEAGAIVDAGFILASGHV